MDRFTLLIVELLSNDSYIRWIKGEEDADDEYWQQWVAAHPENRDIEAYTKRIVKLFHTQEHPVSAEEIEEQLIGVRKGIDKNTQ